MIVAGRFHLTYCSNIHPGESWQDVSDVLRTSLPRVRALMNFDGPFAIGLRLSAAAAVALETPATLAAFQEFLAAGGYYVPTINGFPYGAFHGQRVKERVYLPDWRDPARLEYSNRLARVLAALLKGRDDIVGSVSTVPGAFRSDVRSAGDEDAIASNILRHAAHLASLRRRTGTTITLALEPEPACLLETVADAVSFFERSLFDGDRIQRVAREVGVALTEDEVRRHVGVCLDACHMAVEFEDPAGAIAALRRAGVRVCKVQVSSALRLADRDSASLASALTPFAEDTYLHQVVERNAGGFAKYTDLPEALDALEATSRSPGAREWRVHFHVPIFLRIVDTFETTQPYLASLLDLLKRDDICPYLEVETYTWDVLPPEHRTSDVCTAIARELTWARTTLES
ncbi:MAG: metabolite traffic protein EboE [Acidobacteriia bacterium]|nr:metabolite traffic protein EboE [Terriglobia bacterium]